MAGGSDLIPQLKTGVYTPSALVDLAGIEELRRIEEEEDGYISVQWQYYHIWRKIS